MMLLLEQDQMFVALFNAILVCVLEKTATGMQRMLLRSVSAFVPIIERDRKA
jgi:hypothetical protein